MCHSLNIIHLFIFAQSVDVEDTRELISMYRSTYRQTASALASGLRVKIMGGLMSMEL